MELTLLGWWLVIFLFLKIAGITTWSWGITLFPLWIVIGMEILRSIFKLKR